MTLWHYDFWDILSNLAIPNGWYFWHNDKTTGKFLSNDHFVKSSELIRTFLLKIFDNSAHSTKSGCIIARCLIGIFKVLAAGKHPRPQSTNRWFLICLFFIDVSYSSLPWLCEKPLLAPKLQVVLFITSFPCLCNLFEVFLFYWLQLHQQNHKRLSAFNFICPHLQIRYRHQTEPDHIKRNHSTVPKTGKLV